MVPVRPIPHKRISNVMFTRSCLKNSWCKIQKRYKNVQKKNQNVVLQKCETSKIRNIGILAHIDAGKTTTTERMLYYSGLIHSMGEVHHGNTVTDYMEQERQRGITITSAAVTFNWKNYRINLVDTPGHIDFTMEVEQTLKVLDGAIVILDGSAGVEAQTLTVCRQADKYNIPRMIYVNKMDRPDANFKMCLESIEEKLCVEALPVQLPIKDSQGLQGIVNVLTLEKTLFDKENKGAKFTKSALTETQDGQLWEQAQEARRLLADKLSGVDDLLADLIIEQASLDKINPQDLVNALRRCTISRKCVPVLLGSSYKNIGVQLLMDSVLLYLPSPETNELLQFYKHFGNNLSARVFKIVHDKQKGPITFLRIYTGSLQKGNSVYNVQRTKSEICKRLYIACADDYQDVNTVDYGNIVAVSGLNSTIMGDLITTSASAARKAQTSMENNGLNMDEVEKFFTPVEHSMEPVFFCSVEPPSMSYQSALEVALAELAREDPSLQVVYDDNQGQTILGGMGELHIDIIKERIRREYKVDVDLGPLQVAYKETIQTMARDTFSIEQAIADSKYWVTLELSLLPNHKEKDILSFDTMSEHCGGLARLPPKRVIAIRQGIDSALQHGPKLSCPVVNVGVKLHSILYTKDTADSIFSAAVSQCIKQLLAKCSPVLLQPIMQLEITLPDEYTGKILADLAKRRASICDVEIRGNNKCIHALVPLSKLLDFSTTLRVATSGYATFSMSYSHYEIMDSASEEETMNQHVGF